MPLFLIDRVIHELGLYVYKMYNLVEKTFVSALHRAKQGWVASTLIT
jgi:hypothetical protein